MILHCLRLGLLPCTEPPSFCDLPSQAGGFDSMVGGSLAQARAARRREAAARMHSAFTGGMPDGVDIFTAAARCLGVGVLIEYRCGRVILED